MLRSHQSIGIFNSQVKVFVYVPPRENCVRPTLCPFRVRTHQVLLRTHVCAFTTRNHDFHILQTFPGMEPYDSMLENLWNQIVVLTEEHRPHSTYTWLLWYDLYLLCSYLFVYNTDQLSMLSTPCDSVQICTDPDRYSSIRQKLTSHNYSFEIKIIWLKSALQDKHALIEVFKKSLCESVQICTDRDRHSRICQKLTIRQWPINYYNVFKVFSNYYNYSSKPSSRNITTTALNQHMFQPRRWSYV